MNAVEKLEAAITKLEGLRGNATYGPWFVGGEGEYLFNFGPAHCDIEASEFAFADLNNMDDGDLIVTLHRTIDAQLAILRDAHERYSKQPDKEPVAPSGLNAVALADAILGGGPNE